MAGEAEGAGGGRETGLSLDKGSEADPAKAGDAGKAAEAANGGDPAKAGEAAAGGEGGDKGKDGKADAPKLHGAPEKYSDFKMPEGVEADKALIEEALPVFKELNLSQDGAQKLVDFHNGLLEKQAKAAADAADKVWNDTVDNWQKQTKEHPEIGGPKYETSLATARKAIGAFFKTPAEKQAWSDFASSTGVGEHPVLTLLLARIGAQIKEDGIPNKDGNAGNGQLTQEQRAARLYPTMAQGT